MSVKFFRQSSVAVVILGLTAGACGKTPAGGSTAAPAGSANLTAAEITYGVSPTRNNQVTYQDDVIIMEHGAEAIRSQAANGLTWTIDANAPGARDIQRDKVLFATGRVVGRVLAVEQNGNALSVTLGPIELTDVIKEAHISYQGPLELDKMIAYMAPDYPGTFTDLDVPEQAAVRDSPPVLRFVSQRAPARVVPAAYLTSGVTEASGGTGGALPSSIPINGFNFVPDVSKGLGVSTTHTEKQMRFTASAKLYLDNPSFAFRLDITPGGLQTAEVELSGVAGVRVAFDGVTTGEFRNPNQAFELPLDISFPVPGIPVPFSASFHQSILIHTMFTWQNAELHAAGEYAFRGTIRAGVVNGQLGATAPIFVETKKNLASTMTGASAGVNGLVLGYGGKFIVGLGAWGLAVGPYLSANTTVGVTRGSDLQAGVVGFSCRSAQYEMYLEYGVGYAIPGTVVKALNSFLSLFHVQAIEPTHGTSLGKLPIKINSEGVPPGCVAAAT